MSYQHTTEIDFAGAELLVTLQYDFDVYEGHRSFGVISATGQWIETKGVFDFTKPIGFMRVGEEIVEKSAPFEITGTLLHMLQANDALIDEIAAGWDGAPSAYDLRREEAIADIVRSARIEKADAEAAKKIISEIQERAARKLSRHDSLRDLAAWAMAECGLTRIAAPDCTISLGRGRASVHIGRDPTSGDFSRMPGLVQERITYAWRKEAIREALERGEEVEFARASNGAAVLSVRVR